MSNTTTINDLEVQSALAKLAQQVRNKDPVLDAIGGELLKRVQLGFRNSQSPEGVPWAPLKKRTGKPLVDSSRLRDSITYIVNGDSGSVGTNVIYAAIHNFGGDIQHAARSQQAYFKKGKDGISNKFVKKNRSNFSQWVTIGAHSVTIPARSFLPTGELPSPWRDSILRIIQSHLQHAID